MRKRGASFKYALKLASAGACLAWFALAAEVAHGQGAANTDATNAFNHLISTHCVDCHNADDWAGSLAMDTLDIRLAGQDPEIWEKAISKLRGRLMPPAGKKQPGQSEIDAFVGYLETSVDAAAKDRRVGHVPIQRLNRAEFAASVKGLVGVEVDPKQVLPTEIEVEGFSNIAGALGISPSFMEQYLSAARRVAQRAVGEPVPKMASVFYKGGGGGGGQRGPGADQTSHRAEACALSTCFLPMVSIVSTSSTRTTLMQACIRVAWRRQPHSSFWWTVEKWPVRS
jgi:mono/diheme cytochrome c family protein